MLSLALLLGLLGTSTLDLLGHLKNVPKARLGGDGTDGIAENGVSRCNSYDLYNMI